MIDGDDTFPSDMDAMLQLPGARDTVRALLKLALAEDTGELGCVVQRAMCVCYAHAHTCALFLTHSYTCLPLTLYSIDRYAPVAHRIECSLPSGATSWAP